MEEMIVCFLNHVPSFRVLIFRGFGVMITLY